MSSHGRLDLTSYISVDDIHEDVYQRLYSEADFRADPRWDRLIGHWPGVPYLNQFYRPGWQTRRTNTLAYLKADWSFDELSSLSAGAYYHRLRGRGDWLPPYIVDVVDDGDGPESELAGSPPIRGGTQLGVIRFVDSNGVAIGNEGWAYKDNVNSPLMRDWLGRVVDRDDLTRHDKWCCMMMPRLKLLRGLSRTPQIRHRPLPAVAPDA